MGGFGEWERGRLGDGGETTPFLKSEVSPFPKCDVCVV
jgi:hypothetical protein